MTGITGVAPERSKLPPAALVGAEAIATDLSHHAWRLQKSVFEVLVRAKAASDDPTPAEGSDCGVIPGRCGVSHDFQSALERRAPPMPLNTVYGPS